MPNVRVSKIPVFALMIVLSVAGASAQNAIHLFGPVLTARSGPVTIPAQATAFQSSQTLTLTCNSEPSAILSSTPDGTGNIFADNFIRLTVNGTAVNGGNVCAGGTLDTGEFGTSQDCFSEGWHSNAFAGANPDTATVGDRTFLSTYGVPPLHLGGFFPSGTSTAKIELMDWGGLLGGSTMYLVTSCATSESHVLHYDPGTFVSATAVFDGPDTNSPSATSFKSTCTQVTQAYDITVTATKFPVIPAVSAVGDCQTGQTTDTNLDCRLTQFFGFSSDGHGGTLVPQCVETPNDPTAPDGAQHCTVYHVDAPDPHCTPPIYFYVAGNFFSGNGIPPSINNSPVVWNDNSLQLYDDHQLPNPQFNLNNTFWVTSANGQVGKDWGVGGGGISFNDFVVAHPPAPANNTYSWDVPLRPTGNVAKSGSVVPVKFTLTGPDATNALTFPNHVNLAVLSSTTPCPDTDGHYQPLTTSPASSGFPTFSRNGNHYQMNVLMNYPAGTYKLIVNSTVFPQQCADVTIK